MKILITSDNHVGYNEQDPIRGEDAAHTFDEIMQIAEDRQVDFVIQGGDLFHINKPSKQSLYDVIMTLRKRCLGDKPIEFELLDNGQLSLDPDLDHANFEDPNINVAIPVFAISGNHDDRGGTVLLSPLDVLSCTGLVNYFGRVLNNDNIEVYPLLFQKGDIKVALYGLSNVRDERLHRAFRDKKVKFFTAPDQNQYFNILVVHQNRSAHTETNYLPDRFIPPIFNLVIWGHEHECRIDPEVSPNMGFEVIQPGSSVATSLCEGEAVKKCVAILDIEGPKAYKLEKIPLRTVRPFLMKTVSVAHDSGILPSKAASQEISNWMKSQVEELIYRAKNEWIELNPQVDATNEESIPKPLIRLRVDYSGGYEVENPSRFSNRFSSIVANPNDVVHYVKRREIKQKSVDADVVEFEPSGANKAQLNDLVRQFVENQTLQVLPRDGILDTVHQYVVKDDKSALKDFVEKTIEQRVHDIVEANMRENGSDGSKIKSAPLVYRDDDRDEDVTMDIEEVFGDSGEEVRPAHTPARTSARKPTAKSRKTRAPEPVSISESEEEELDEIDSDSPVEVEPPKKSRARTTRAAAKAATKPAAKSAAKPRAKKTTGTASRKAAAPKEPIKAKSSVKAPPLKGGLDSDDDFD